jgi:hypothetical protein
MLSQEMLRNSKPWFPRSETGQPLLHDLVIASLFPMNEKNEL